MIKLILPAAAVILLSVTAAQSQKAVDDTAHAAPKKPGVDTTALPPDPVAVQKWLGQAVGDILDSADRTLNDRPNKDR